MRFHVFNRLFICSIFIRNEYFLNYPVNPFLKIFFQSFIELKVNYFVYRALLQLDIQWICIPIIKTVLMSR